MSANTALFVSPSVVPSSSINGLAEDVWFGIRTDGVAGTITGPLVRNSDGTVSVTGTAVITGNGSAINPYDASDYIKFDALMRMLGHPVSTTFSGSIVSVGTGNPATVTTALPHGMQTGVPVTLASVSGSTPTVNGSHIITVTGPTTFTIPVNVTVGGTGGTFTTTYGVVPAFTIHLGKGEFKTLGQMMPDSTYSFPAYNSANYPTYLPDNTGGYTTTGWYMYSGWRILGEGQGSTTLSLDHWPIYGGSPYPYGISLIEGSDGSLGYWADDTEVANLTIDCNWPYITGKPVGATALNAILLYGDRIKVHDITVLNAYGQSPAEAFVVFLTRRITDGFFLGQGYPNVSLDSKNLRIEHTISDLWQGSYGSALAIDPGFTGGCFLIDNYVHNWITGTSALQGGGNYGEVAGNTIENAGTGFYTEATASGINNFHFHHNILLGIRHSAIEISLGVTGTPGNSDGCVIEENTIIADLANASSPSMIHCFVSTTGSLTNLRIADNYITKTGSHGGTLYGINTAFANGLTITGNTIVSALSNQLVSCTNTTLSGNRDQNSAVASGLTDTTLPESLGGTGATSFTAGSIVFAGSSALSQDNARLFYDATNHRLGVLTATPAYDVDVNGLINMPATSTTVGQLLIAGNPVLQLAGGSSNIHVGSGAANLTTTAVNNVVVGGAAMVSVTSGGYNVAIGHNALSSLTTGSGIVAIGESAAYSITTDGDDMALGYAAFGASLGSGNVFIGREAGRFLGGGSGGGNATNCVGIGYQAQFQGTSGLTNAVAIGANSCVTASNSIVLGASGTSVGIGNTAPAYLLDVTGTGRTNSSILNPGAAPGSPVEGQMYYDSSTHHFFGWTGAAWKQLDN